MTRDIYTVLEARRMAEHRAKWERACQRHKRAAMGLCAPAREWWRRLLPWN